MNLIDKAVSLFPRRLGVLACLSFLFLLLAASPALAHVDLESSDPGDGNRVSASPELIELVFTVEAVPAGDGIVLLDADGTPVPVTISQPEADVVHVVPRESLTDGVYGVQWTMKAGDAHPRAGVVTFRVEATAPPPTDMTDGAGPSAPSTGGASTGSTETEGVGERSAGFEPVFEPSATGSIVGELMSRSGRWAAMVGTVVAIGAFVFAATTLIGTRREVEEVGYWVRRAAVLIVVGTVIEASGTSMVLAGSAIGGLAPSAVVEAVAGSYGFATLLRVLGGAVILAGTAIIATEAVRPIADASRLPVPTGGQRDVAVLERTSPAYRLDVHRERLAMIGIGLVTASYLFDGHTVTTSPRLLVMAASATHVLAGAVWVGGVLTMAWTLAHRQRRGVELGVDPMVIRFSRVASFALVAVAVAGSALAVAILDTPSELLTTSWGRILIIKLIAVGAAATIGAYNHLVTVPALDADPGDGPAAHRLRRLVKFEGGVLLAVVAVTAVLVAAAS